MEANTLVLQMLNEKLNKMESSVEKLTSLMERLLETSKDNDINIQVMTKYLSNFEDLLEKPRERPQLREPNPRADLPRFQPPSQPQLGNQFGFPDLEGPEGSNLDTPFNTPAPAVEPSVQGDWTGGFGGASGFNPLEAPVVSAPPSIDYSYRPPKNRDDVEQGTNVIYVYESPKAPEIDQEDLDDTLAKIEKESDKEAFKRALGNIVNGIKTIYSTRDPQLYFENITILNTAVELRYSKVSESSNNTNYSKLFT